jgi:hypothetical protein
MKALADRVLLAHPFAFPRGGMRFGLKGSQSAGSFTANRVLACRLSPLVFDIPSRGAECSASTQ